MKGNAGFCIPMQDHLQTMRDRVRRHAAGLCRETPLPRLGLCVLEEAGAPVSTVYGPMICLVLQGAKLVTIGNRVLRYDAASCFVASVDLPATGCVIEASRAHPYMVTSLSLNLDLLGGLLAALPASSLETNEPSEPMAAGFGVAPVTAALLAAWDQWLALLDAPDDMAVLGPGREREILYRLLQSGHGAMLRQIGCADSRLSRVRRTIAHIRTQFDQPLRTEALAAIAGMSVPSFHRHFKAATGMSPLQYQKSLWLQTARYLLTTNNDAAHAAFSVGYESASQFSREYMRQFGTSPSRAGD